MKHLPALPVELWLKVFRWATLDPWTHILYATDYHPFHSVVPAFTTTGPALSGEAYAHKTKQALPLVCKNWRRWSTPLLYEDIIINDGDCYSRLATALEYGRDLEDGCSMPPCAPLVRRARLPYSSTFTPTQNNPLRALDVLRLCTESLRVLVRGVDIGLVTFRFEFPVRPGACPPLPALRRLDWWHHNEATRTGDVNSLPHVLALAPALTYLSVGGPLWASYAAPPAAAAAAAVHLPRLATLRLRHLNAVSVLQLARWALPALRHAVLDHIARADMLGALWDAFGAQLRVFELGLSVRFFVEDFLAHVLAGCPHLEELYYYVQFTLPPVWQAAGAGDGDGDGDGGGERVMESLRTVGLHAHPNAMFTVGSAEYWSHLGWHFDALCQPTFPALKRVVLYGDWSAVIHDAEFIRVVQPLKTKGCSVEVV
ncbi:hypothetical protein C8Q80DRAFT_1219657 [Daedaleopsis nitida]|nr:hypothetical protein C8Q80DRAFT_1219657 [Daedaleopsis nitida]